MTAVNTSYSSYVLRWVLDVETGTNDINFFSNFTHDTQTTPAGVTMAGISPPTSSIEGRLSTMLSAAYLAINGLLVVFNVNINVDGRLEVYHTGSLAISVVKLGTTTMDLSIFGFDVTNPATETFFPSTLYTSPLQVGAQWNPNMFFANDTGDTPIHKIAQSNTNLMRPSYLKYGDTVFGRVIDWNAIGAARIRSGRVAEQLFADASQLIINDTNAPLEVMVEHVHNEADADLGRVVLFSNASTATGVNLGEYYLLLDESNMLEGIGDDTRFQESSLETFDVTLALRKF